MLKVGGKTLKNIIDQKDESQVLFDESPAL
jgi:hypothetical protein